MSHRTSDIRTNSFGGAMLSSYVKKILAVFLVAFVATTTLGLVAAAPASANTRGQCSGPHSVVSRTTTQLLANLRAEKVVAQASTVFKSAGYSPVDENLPTWFNTRVVTAHLAKSATVRNYMCKNGHLTATSKRTLAAGTLVHVALPKNLSKSDVRTSKPSTAGWVKKMLCVRAVAQTTCSNPISGKVCVWVWVRVKVVVSTPAPAPAPVVCSAGSTLVGGNCVNQTQTASETSKVTQDCSAGTITNGQQCTSVVMQTIIQINANCSQVVFMSGGIVVQSQDVICSTVVTPPAPPAPPVVQPPSFLQFREFNDLEVKTTSDHCVTVTFPSGSGTVFWTATVGSFATSQVNAQSGTQVCSTYTAPTEVPPGITDQILVTVTDGTSGLTAVKTSLPFNILAKFITPQRVMSASQLTA